MSLAGQVSALATRIATEFNSVRSALAGKVDSTRTVSSGTGLTGGGDLSANRTLSVSYGTTAGTAAQGNDARLSDARTPADGSVTDAKVASGAAIAESKLSLASDAAAGTASRRTLGTSATQAAAGNHAHSGYAPTASPTFTGTVTLPADPTSAMQASTKQYVDTAKSRAQGGVVNVLDYGAAGNGSTDDTSAIASAVAACPAGGTVLFPPGIYATTALIDVPENVELRGSHTGRLTYSGTAAEPCVIKPLATHTGTCVIRLRGKGDSSRTYEHVGARIRNLMIDGTNAPSGTRGIACYALVREALFEDVTVYKAPDAGFWCGAGVTDITHMPLSLRFTRCVAHTCGGAGFSFSNVPDTTLHDCVAEGGSWVGFYLAGFQHGTLNACKSEWNNQHGYQITSGYWGTGTGSGGAVFTGCSTDRNGYNGVYVDATGNAALVFAGLLLRRDGRNGGSGGGGYAGFFVSASATMPISVSGINVYPGVDDDGTQTSSPQIGVSSTGSAPPVTVDSGFVHAATTAVSAGSGCVVDRSVGLATGSTSSPTRTAPAADAPTVSPTFTGTVTVPDPTTSSGAASKNYVDGLARGTTRSVSAATTAVVGEVLEVNATSAAVTITPPASPSTGDRVTVVKTDSSANVVTWNATVNGDSGGAQILSQYAGGTFYWDGSGWLVSSVNIAFSGGDTTTALAGKADTPTANPLNEVNFNKLQMTTVEKATFTAGTEVTLFSTTGPGVIVSMWLAVNSNPSLDGRLRIYYDGSATASIDIDFGTLFATHYTATGTHYTPHMSANIGPGTSGSTIDHALLITFPIPFGTSITVTAYNPTGVTSTIYSMVSYRLTTTDNAGGKRLRYTGARMLDQKITRTSTGTNTLASITGGPGALVWFSYVAGVAATNYSWLERNFSISVDGESSPSLVATGTEDWFDSGWYFYGWKDFESSAHSYVGANSGLGQTYVMGMATDYLSKWGGIPFTSSLTMSALTESLVTTGDQFAYSILYYQ